MTFSVKQIDKGGYYMKRFKKLTAGLMGVVMALGVCGFTALAEDGALETVSNIMSANDEDESYKNVLFAKGEDVTVAPDDGDGLIVTVGDTEYTFNENVASADGLTIFAGGDGDNKSYSNISITIKDGATVNTIFGGGHGDSNTDNVTINIEDGGSALAVYGGGLTSYGDGESKAQVGTVDITVDGYANLIYAGGNSAVGVSIDSVINAEEETANNFVKNVNVVINGEVDSYFGSSFSYGGVGKAECTVNGEISAKDTSYSAVTGANGYTGSAKMVVNEDAVVNADVYMAMRGYIMGDVVLENYGEIKRVGLNPDGKDVSTNGEFKVINEGTIKACNIDCGCSKSAIKDKYPAYPVKITVSGDVTVTGQNFETNTGEVYKPVDGQTIYLVDGAKLADGESYSNVKVVADEVGDVVVTTDKGEATVNTGNVTLPDNFTGKTIKENIAVEGLEENINGLVNNNDVETAKEALEEAGAADDADVEIKIVTYIDIKVEEFVNTDTEKVFTVDITPMYKLVAKSSDGKEATINNGKKLDVYKEVEVTIPVPEGVFEDENLFVKHIHNGRTYYYDAELANNKVTFTNPNGFSLISVLNDNRKGSITFKDSDRDKIEKKTYDVADIGSDLPDYEEKGYIFDGWNIDGKVFEVLTEELLNIIDGKEVTAYPVLEEKESSSHRHSYSLKEGKTERDDEEEEPVVTPEPEEEEGPFSDVGKDNPNYDAIVEVYEKGWMAGIGDGVFAPNGTLTRGMAVTILWNRAGQPEPVNVAPFLDVTSDAWYAKAVAWAYENGITSGYGDTYGPDDFITTEQFTRMNDIADGRTPEVYVGGAPYATRGWVAGLLVME